MEKMPSLECSLDCASMSYGTQTTSGDRVANDSEDTTLSHLQGSAKEQGTSRRETKYKGQHFPNYNAPKSRAPLGKRPKIKAKMLLMGRTPSLGRASATQDGTQVANDSEDMGIALYNAHINWESLRLFTMSTDENPNKVVD